MSIGKLQTVIISFLVLLVGCSGLDCTEAKSPNLLNNSSFQLCTIERIPDYWGSDSFTMRHLTTDMNWFETDDDSPVKGTKSVRFNKPQLVFQSYPLELPLDKEHTFSCYLKSDRPKAKATLRISYKKKKEVEISNKWKRFSFTTIPGTGFWRKGYLVVEVIGAGQGKTWMAAPQLEAGTETTPYQLSDFDKLIQNRWIEDRQKAVPNLPVPKLELTKLAQEPKIDGKITTEEWKAAGIIHGLRDCYTGAPAETKTLVYVGYDADNLYIAFSCAEPEIKKIKALSGKAKQAWSKTNQDYVMIQLAPDSTSELSSVFKIDIFGEKSSTRNTHSSYHFARGPMHVGCRYPVEAKMSDKGWDAEFKIPFSHGNVFAADGTIRINFFRMRKSCEIPDKCDPWLSTFGLSSWSPTYGPEDTYPRSGILQPSDINEIRNYFYHFRNPRWLVSEDKTFFCAELCFFRKTPSTGKFNVKNRPLDSSKTVAVDLTIGQPQRIRIPFDSKSAVGPVNWAPNNFAPPQSARGICQLTDTKTDKVIMDFDSDVIKTPLDESFSLLTEFDYYTNDKTATLIAKSRANMPIKFSFDILDVDGNKIKMRLPAMPLEISPHSSTDIEIDIWPLAPGEYKIAVSGEDASGLSYKTETYLLKHPPAETEVRISRRNGALFRNGKGILVYSFAGGWSDDVERHGFNTRMMWHERFTVSEQKELWPQEKAKYKKMLDDFNAKGRMIIHRHISEQSQQALGDVLNHPAIIAKNFTDEPYGKTRQEMEALYKEEKKLNPYRPSFINWGQEWAPGIGGAGTLYATDVASIDFYPFNVWACRAGAGAVDVARWAEKMKTDSLQMGRAIGFWNQLYAFDFAWRHPSPAEMNAFNYLCLINNVRLFYYFRGKPSVLQLWDNMEKFADEFRVLEPYLVSRRSAELKSGIADYAIRYTLWASPAGPCLIACNPLAIPLKGEFSLADLGIGSKTANVLFENRGLKFSDGILKDSFGPFERHVYYFER